MKFFLVFLFMNLLLGGCAQPTPMPAEAVPTAIYLTAQAARPAGLPATAEPAGTAQGAGTDEPARETAAGASDPIPTPAPSPAPVDQPAPTLPTLPAPTQAVGPLPPYVPAGLPEGLIEIRNLGPLSRVVSPLHVWGYLKTGAGSKARIELLGEDGRLLFGETRVFDVPEGAHAVLSLDIAFEITAAAEAGRLQIWVEDGQGRVTALNAVPLILMSLGEADINPPADVFSPLVIEQPKAKALIQGGSLLVTGLARLAPEATLLARLLDEEGSQVGMRLAEVSLPPEGGYGSFAAEVPYQVDGPTRALLVLSAGADGPGDIIHLTSLEVLLSP